MQNIDTVYIELKNFSKAILHLEEALNIYKTLFKNQVKPVLLNCLASIGYAYEQISNFPEGVSCYKQALERICTNVWVNKKPSECLTALPPIAS